MKDDVVVIGAGAAGVCCASLAAGEGKRVAALERSTAEVLLGRPRPAFADTIRY